MFNVELDVAHLDTEGVAIDTAREQLEYRPLVVVHGAWRGALLLNLISPSIRVGLSLHVHTF